MLKPNLAVVAALIEKDGSVLLCQRNSDDHYGGLWEFPGGAIERGETPQKAIEREIKEELDIDVQALEKVETFFDEDPGLKITVFLYRCSILGGTLSAKECQAFGFFTINQMKKLNLAPVDLKIAQYLINKYQPL